MRFSGRLTPEQFWAHVSSMEDQVRAQAHLLPLYGLAQWDGPRMVGDWGTANGELTTVGLYHGEPDDGPRVHVMVDTRDPGDPVQERRMSAVDHEADRDAVMAALDRAASPATATVTISVDGNPEIFDHWVDGTTWYAARQHGEHALVIEAHDVSPDDVAVVRVDDVEPYLAGRRAWIRHKRGED